MAMTRGRGPSSGHSHAVPYVQGSCDDRNSQRLVTVFDRGGIAYCEVASW